MLCEHQRRWLNEPETEWVPDILVPRMVLSKCGSVLALVNHDELFILFRFPFFLRIMEYFWRGGVPLFPFYMGNSYIPVDISWIIGVECFPMAGKTVSSSPLPKASITIQCWISTNLILGNKWVSRITDRSLGDPKAIRQKGTHLAWIMTACHVAVDTGHPS